MAIPRMCSGIFFLVRALQLQSYRKTLQSKCTNVVNPSCLSWYMLKDWQYLTQELSRLLYSISRRFRAASDCDYIRIIMYIKLNVFAM